MASGPSSPPTEREYYGRRCIEDDDAGLAAVTLLSGYGVEVVRDRDTWRYVLPSEPHVCALRGEAICGQLDRLPVDPGALDVAQRRLQRVRELMALVGAHAQLVAP